MLMKLAISAGALFLLLGTIAPAYAQGEQHEKEQGKPQQGQQHQQQPAQQHQQQGNVGLADGSVQGFSRSSLQNAFNNSGDTSHGAVGSFVTGENRLQFAGYAGQTGSTPP